MQKQFLLEPPNDCNKFRSTKSVVSTAFAADLAHIFALI